MRRHVLVWLASVGVAGLPGAHPMFAQHAGAIGIPARPPISAIASLAIPQPSRFKLKNGLRVLIVHDPRAPLFEARLVIGSGWRTESGDEAGTSLLLREAILRGNPRVPGGTISSPLDSLAVEFAAAASGTDAEGLTTSFRMSGPSPSLEPAMAFLSAAVRQTDLAQLNRQRSRYVERRRQAMGDPLTLASERVLRSLRAPALRDNAIPSDSVLLGQTAEQVSRFHSERYTPGNAILVIVAPDSIDALQAIVSRCFGAWKGPPAERRSTREAPSATGGLETLLRTGSTQATIAVGGRVGGQADSANAAILLLRVMLLRRLSSELRVARGWTYGVSAPLVQGASSGTLVIRTSVKPGRTADALAFIEGELARLASAPADSAEVDFAVRLVTSALARAAESREVVAERVATAEVLGLSPNYWAEVQRALTRLDGAELQRLARRYFVPARMSVVVVGDSTELRSVKAVSQP